jgi:hypothetical protein
MVLLKKTTLFLGASPKPELTSMALKKGITLINECMLVMLDNGIF